MTETEINTDKVSSNETTRINEPEPLNSQHDVSDFQSESVE